jgi:hypothetical protein
MEMQSRWKWNGENAAWIDCLAHTRRGGREGEERELSYMEVLSHGNASGIQQIL